MSTAPLTRTSVTVAAVALTVALLCSACSGSATGASTSTSPPATTTAKVATGAPVPSPGCARPQTGPVTDEHQTIEVDGASRWYLLNTPSPTVPGPTGTHRSAGGAPIPRPLVVDFHGLSEGAVIHSTTTMFGSLGQKDGFVTVFPQGRGTPIPTSPSSRPC
jgi:poly(3-hydroxybutyrate) depolymerase